MSTPVPNPNTNPDPSKVVSVKIFPPIGIARLGDSGFDLDKGKPVEPTESVPDPIEWFIPSEIPGVEDAPAGGFRDSSSSKRIKRQAARFRVYAYGSDGKNLGEITHDEKYQLTWTVHVANAKGSFRMLTEQALRNPHVQGGLESDTRTKLIVDSKEKSISSIDEKPVDLAGKFQGSKETGVDVGLGQLRTDNKGRLVFIPAPGYSRSVADPKHFQPDTTGLDNDDWVDDTCDGWVDVKVEFKAAVSKHWDAKEKATIISAPPQFSWGMTAPTSLYDLIEDIYSEKWNTDRKTEFYQDIWPVLRGAYLLSWTNKEAAKGHGPNSKKGNFLPQEAQLKDPSQASEGRKSIFKQLRVPPGSTSGSMPKLSGWDSAVTKLQYEHFKKWSEGTFSNKTAPWENNNYDTLEKVPLELQPLFLTRAALEHTIGAPLDPGIEAWSVMKEKSTYKIPSVTDKNPDPPFRIDHNGIKPGHLGRGLSLPWQTDFKACGDNWWPSIRPDDVFKKSDWGDKKIDVKVFTSSKFDQKQKQWASSTTDMVRSWQNLGFVSKHGDYAVTKGAVKMPVWLEE